MVIFSFRKITREKPCKFYYYVCLHNYCLFEYLFFVRFYLPFIVGNRRFSRTSISRNKDEEKESKPINSIQKVNITLFHFFHFRLQTLSLSFYCWHVQRKETPKENIWTIPNYLTFSRLIVSPIIGYFILNDQYDLALSAFIYAGFSDLV